MSVSNVEIDPKPAVMNSIIPEQLWNSLSTGSFKHIIPYKHIISFLSFALSIYAAW